MTARPKHDPEEGMSPSIGSARSDVEGLAALAPLWAELHRHHRDVSSYPDLVADPDASWTRRRDWYERVLASGGSYITATDDSDVVVGYAMVAFEDGLDDTFDVKGGIAEVVSLVVTRDRRSAGLGQMLLRAAEDMARSRGFDTLKIAVMSGNTRAQAFYERAGYVPAENVLYRRLGGRGG